jgi:hypothetical protein
MAINLLAEEAHIDASPMMRLQKLNHQAMELWGKLANEKR